MNKGGKTINFRFLNQINIYNVEMFYFALKILWKCSFKAANSKTAISFTPPTVGRQSADLSADKIPDFSSFFIGRQKINYNYLVIIIFPSAYSFGVLAIGR